MQHGAFEQVGHGGNADVGMGAHVVRPARHHVQGAEMVQKQDGADRLTLRRRQQPAHYQPFAQILGLSGQLKL